jgi:hypothetical protein
MHFLLPAALAVALMTGTAVAEEAVTPHPLPNGTTEVLYAEVLYVIAGLLVVLIAPWLRDLFVWCFTAAVGTGLRLLARLRGFAPQKRYFRWLAADRNLIFHAVFCRHRQNRL